MDIHEHYVKQSYRNRTHILTANGILSLVIPVKKTSGHHTAVKDIRILYDEKWQRQHWRAITSAYNKAPYFLYFQDELVPFYEKKYHFLHDFNTELFTSVLQLMGANQTVHYTGSYVEKSEGIHDLRNAFHPKKRKQDQIFPSYLQVFSDKFGFSADLSILDLLLNEGNFALDYLSKIIPKV